MRLQNFEIDIDTDGIATVAFGAVDRTMNTLTMAIWQELSEVVKQIATDPSIKGAVLISSKENGFCAGADLDEMMKFAGVRPTEATEQRAVEELLGRGNRVARSLETCGKPVVAALNGLALGGGLELALACHYRIVRDDRRVQLGLPEASIGLLPGAGGTQRVPRLLGIAKALPILLEGNSMSPDEALQLGLVDEMAAKGNELKVAKAWIRSGGSAVARWDRAGFSLPDGGSQSAGDSAFMAAKAQVIEKSHGNYPAMMNITCAVFEGMRVPFDAAQQIETRFFVDTLQSPQALAMVRTIFESYPALKRGAARANATAAPVHKVSILGAGTMGAGIAFSFAEAGIETVLIDTTLDAARLGKAYSRRILDRRVAKASVTTEGAAALLERIVPSDDYAAITGSDLVIETVFEDMAIKAEATRKALQFISAGVLFASNTSTLPISRLAGAHRSPENFIGMHFHSPVDRMELVEVVVGSKTSEESIARALSCVRQIGKTPIIAHDSPFFYTSRTFDTYIREGMEMLVDGIAPEIIDQVGRMIGMPRGPLELSDDVAIDLLDRIAKQRRVLLGAAAARRRSDDVVDLLMEKARFGRKNRKGFYDYEADGSKSIWRGLHEAWPVTMSHSTPLLVIELKRRLLNRQSLEAARCLAEGVLDDPRYADVGAMLGWNFPRWTGGPISYIEQVGIADFVQECDAITLQCGERFTPPEMLRRMALDGRGFYSGDRYQAAPGGRSASSTAKVN